jgi:hypothetical protein
MTTQDSKTVELALGRIFRLASRPEQPGDVEDYERCRRLILDILDPNGDVKADHAHDYARDYGKGAQGQW